MTPLTHLSASLIPRRADPHRICLSRTTDCRRCAKIKNAERSRWCSFSIFNTAVRDRCQKYVCMTSTVVVVVAFIHVRQRNCMCFYVSMNLNTDFLDYEFKFVVWSESKKC